MTSMSKSEAAVAFLFGQPGETVEDVKFFAGKCQFSEDEFWEQVQSAQMQERLGTATITTVFEDSAPTVDARAFLLSL